MPSSARGIGAGRQLARRFGAGAACRARRGADRLVLCAGAMSVSRALSASMRGSESSQMPIETKATNSNTARVMRPAVSTTMPVARRATHKAVARRNPRLRPGRPSALTTIARNDRPRPLAMMSCIIELTGIGTRPTALRWSPADTTEPRKARAVRRPVYAGSATARKTP